MIDPRTLTYTELVQALQRAYEDQARADEKRQALCKIGASAMSCLSDMVAAYDCDYDRLQELRDAHKAGHYVAGWNMPGYLPDSEPAAFDDADDAREFLASALEADANETDNWGHSAELQDAMRADAETLRGLSGEGSAADFGATLGGLHYWITWQSGIADADDAAELAELETAAGECEDQEDAERRIQEDPLSIEYRATWAPGETPDPDEAIILLTTGGPAVRIVAQLGRGGVSRAYLQVQDWFTPWTDVACDPNTLVRYCEILGVGAEL